MLETIHRFLRQLPFYFKYFYKKKKQEAKSIKVKYLSNDNDWDRGILNNLFHRNIVVFVSKLRSPNQEILENIIMVPKKI